MLHYVVTFDIPDDATRREVGDLLGEYGTRVQRSVFEIRCRHRREYEALRRRLRGMIDPGADSLRFYRLCADCRAASEELGGFPDPFDREGVFFF
jgi:CRISPR-associated protein Cas2